MRSSVQYKQMGLHLSMQACFPCTPCWHLAARPGASALAHTNEIELCSSHHGASTTGL